MRKTHSLQFRARLRHFCYLRTRLNNITCLIRNTNMHRRQRNLVRVKQRIEQRLLKLNLRSEFRTVRASITCAPAKRPIVHCVGKDTKFGAGAALDLKRRYPSVRNFSTVPKVGRCTLSYCGRHVFINAVTKAFSSGKPRFCEFKRAVVHLRELCVKHRWHCLSITRLRCGLDALNWSAQVQPLLVSLFESHPMLFFVIHTCRFA